MSRFVASDCSAVRVVLASLTARLVAPLGGGQFCVDAPVLLRAVTGVSSWWVVLCAQWWRAGWLLRW